jgi:AcrR family transcriptional regulator
VARWDPDARGRLQRAAVELFTEFGYDAVTSGQIAERAGLTRRSYFRYYPDKREVLFDGSDQLVAEVRERMDAADPGLPPLERIVAALGEVGSELLRIDRLPERRAIIAATPELQERERTKMAAVAQAVADSFVAAGMDVDRARLAGRVGIELFRTAIARAVAAGDDRLDERLREAIADLRSF